MQIINNTSSHGILLKEFIDNPPNDDLTLLHQIFFLSNKYDIVIDKGNILVCDKE